MRGGRFGRQQRRHVGGRDVAEEHGESARIHGEAQRGHGLLVAARHGAAATQRQDDPATALQGRERKGLERLGFSGACEAWLSTAAEEERVQCLQQQLKARSLSVAQSD
jgi:hypothetical protein